MTSVATTSLPAAQQATSMQMPGHLHSLCVSLPYQADPLRLQQQLCGDRPHNLLLESAEIDSKQSLKSLLMVDASLQLECQGNRVTVTALSANGAQLLPWLADAFKPQMVEQQANSLSLEFPMPATDLNEDERLRAAANDAPLRLLQQGLTTTNDHPLAVFLGGVFGYDYIATFETLPEVPTGANQCPDYLFYLAETLLITDHQTLTTELLASVLSGPNYSQEVERLSQRVGELAARAQLVTSLTEPAKANFVATDFSAVEASPSRAEYHQIVERMQQHIDQGDIFQVVPARQFRLACSDTRAAYAALKQANPSPYMFLLTAADFHLFGASPESALKYTAATNQVELYPIAGTRPRGKRADQSIDHDLDSRLELELRMDQKELAEHLMLVDLARNDLARIAIPGSRHVADLLKVDRYSHVMHLVSRVVAQLAPDLDALHAYRACMNMGTLVGAPKLKAAQLIRNAEGQRRGSYGGAVGYLAGNGDMDTCIVIRAAYVQQGQALVQAGAGVVHDSVAAAETAETEAKASAVIQAIQTAERALRGAV